MEKEHVYEQTEQVQLNSLILNVLRTVLPFCYCGYVLCISEWSKKVGSIMAGIYFSQVCFFFAWDLAAVCIFGVSVIARCPQGES